MVCWSVSSKRLIQQMQSPHLTCEQFDFINGAQVFQIQTLCQESQADRQCKGRQPRNFDFLRSLLGTIYDAYTEQNTPLLYDCPSMERSLESGRKRLCKSSVAVGGFFPCLCGIADCRGGKVLTL